MNGTLREYFRKRNFDRTPEPAGRVQPQSSKEALRFVIQKHAARRLHYDLRLELDGVLKCWAIPRGPSSDPNERRLAVAIEDHPLEYASFEGAIPEGEYGAGEVIVWDAGVYSPDQDSTFFFGDRVGAEERVRRGLAQGSLSIFFWGYKLAGSWSLTRRRGSETEWFLVKRDDLFGEPSRELQTEDRSVLSGRTIEDLREESAPMQARRRA